MTSFSPRSSRRPVDHTRARRRCCVDAMLPPTRPATTCGTCSGCTRRLWRCIDYMLPPLGLPQACYKAAALATGFQRSRAYSLRTGLHPTLLIRGPLALCFSLCLPRAVSLACLSSFALSPRGWLPTRRACLSPVIHARWACAGNGSVRGDVPGVDAAVQLGGRRQGQARAQRHPRHQGRCRPHADRVLTTCSPHAHHMFTVCSLCAGHIPTTC